MKRPSYPYPRCSSLSGSRPSRRPRREEGYILLIMMMVATLLLISLAAAVPSVYVEGQREREKELIFRGEQYARAIELFHKKFNRYPTSIKELLHTDNLSFLRQRFRDPMTKSGKWRYIYATANGIVLNSKILGPPKKQKSIFGSANKGAGAPQSNSQQGGLGMGNFSLPGLGSNSGQNQMGSSSSSGLGSNSSQNQMGSNSSNFFGDKKKLVGVYIVGVASTSHQQSIGVFDHRTQYDEWEFLGIPGAPGAPNLGVSAIIPGATPSSNGSTSQPNSGGFHLSPTPSSQPGAGSILGGESNP